jgi:glycosyltransferase involved in cell wall biosynthesis
MTQPKQPASGNAGTSDDAPARRLRAVLFGTGRGIFPPLAERFAREFEIVRLPEVRYPRLLLWFFLLISFHPSKKTWYRRWRHWVEHSPVSFLVVTRALGRVLQRHRGEFDLVLHFGAQCAPGFALDKPYFVFTDSCRLLSSQNPHDEVCHFRSEGEKRRWLALEGEVYRNARRVFVGSQFVRDAITAGYGVARDSVIATGFGAGLGFGESFAKTFDGKSVLYVGKGDFEKKGGLVLLRAFEEVRRQRPEAVLHIVGQPGLPSSPGVVSHGFVTDRQKLLALMREAHVLTLPSLVDRFGIVLVEAMACWTPCVSSDYGAMPEVVGDAGLVVSSGDSDALAKALLGLLGDAERSRELGLRGRSRYETYYNWETIWRLIRTEVRLGLNESSRRTETG